MDSAAFFTRKRLIGMVHLGPLPGSARDSGDLSGVIARAVDDARALESGGIDALMVENFFDAPFHKSGVPPHTVAAMTAAVLAVRAAVAIPIGVNVLRNDACAAMGIAHASGAAFIRCNVYVGAVVTDQGIIEGAAREVVDLRRRLGAHVAIWADIFVKHAMSLVEWTIETEARDAVERGLADAIIVTGSATGSAPEHAWVRDVKAAVPQTPVLVGSGVDVRDARTLLREADGAIVGSSLKIDGVVSNPVDVDRVRALVAVVARHFSDQAGS